MEENDKELTEEEKLLEEIEELAARLMPVKEIAVITGLDYTSLRTQLRDSTSRIYQAYYRGYLKTKAEIQQSVVSHAKAGSSPAQALAHDYLTRLTMEESDEWR